MSDNINIKELLKEFEKTFEEFIPKDKKFKKKKIKRALSWLRDEVERGFIPNDLKKLWQMSLRYPEEKGLIITAFHKFLTIKYKKNENEENVEQRIENNKNVNIMTIKNNVGEIEMTETNNVQHNREIIGRVSLTLSSSSTPTQFYVWIKDDPNIHIEPGTLITVEDENLKVVGIVEDIKAMSEVPNTISEFYGWGYGNPYERISTNRPVIREALVRVISRSDGRTEPLMRKHPVYLSNKKEIINAYSHNISENRRFLVGFTKDANNEFVPVYADFDYIFGYNGVHVNISGASGLAAKTSYALFLIMSALAYSKKHGNDGVAIVAFNVKEKDLLEIMKFKEKFKNMDEVISYLKHDNNRLKCSAEMWKKLQELENYKIDPFELLSEENVHIYEPGKHFKFGFMDLVYLADDTPDLLRLLFDKEDINDNFEALLLGIIQEYYKDGAYSFDGILNDISSKLSEKSRSSSKGQYVYIGGIPHHSSTVGKFIRRIESVLNQLSKIIDRKNPWVGEGKCIIDPDHLKPGHLIIINIEPLPDRGKRLVFLSVLKVLNKILEEKKEGNESIDLFGETYPLKDFPNRIAVFVDELNKFAPSGKAYSAIKAPIIDIAARGRSIGLSLIGAQQMASQIDQEVLANSSTFVVGRSHPIEISGKVYDWLKGGLKERVTFLNQGELIMYHAIHSAPVLINFPIPLHRIQ